MQNYLLHSINHFYKEMASLEGRIYVLNWYMNRYKNETKKLKQGNENLAGSILTTKDLTKLTAGSHSFDTYYGYTLKYDDVNDEINYILSREYCFSLAQLYEMTESYLLNIITEFLFRNQQYLITLKLLNSNLILTKGAVKELVNVNLSRKKNNRKLISAIKKSSQFYTQHEIINTHGINLSSWFDLFSEVRHNITHSRSGISVGLLKYLNDKEKKSLFDFYFDSKKTYDGVVIFLSYQKFELNVQLLRQFVYFIFKSLSVESKLDPRYFKVR